MSENTKVERPEGIRDEHLQFLYDLRESGATNMFGAAQYLDEKFPELRDKEPGLHSSKKAQAILSYWMKTFGQAR